MSIKWYDAKCVFKKLKEHNVTNDIPELDNYNHNNSVNQVNVTTNSGLRIYQIHYPEKIIRNNITFETSCKIYKLEQTIFDECAYTGII